VTKSGQGEAVQGLVLGLRGANAQQVVAGVKARLAEIAPTLPAGVTVHAFYDRSNLVGRAVGTVSKALLEAIVLVVLLLLGSVAHAQPGETPLIVTAPPPAMKPVDQKDPSIAVLLSLGLPVVGALTMAAADSEETAWLGFGGLYLGPSVGRWYAGEFGAGTLALRTLGGLSMVAGFGMVLGSECDYEYDCSDSNRRGTIGGVMMLTGAGLWLGSTFADIYYAKTDTESWNKRHSMAVGPTLVGSDRSPGVMLSGRF